MSVADPIVQTWDGEARRIHLKAGVSSYFPMDDLYFEYRHERRTNEDFRKWAPLLRAEGKVPKGGGAFTPRYVVLIDSTKVIPYNESDRLDQLGDMITDDPDVDPTLYDISTLTVPKVIFIKPSEAEIIELNSKSIEYASFNGGVIYDANSGNSGTLFPTGTEQKKVNNMTDTLLIANLRGFNKIYFHSNITLGVDAVLNNFICEGYSHTNTEVTVESAAQVVNTVFRDCILSGTLDGGNSLTQCVVGDLTYVNGHIHSSSLVGMIILAGSKDAYFVNCSMSDWDNIPEIDMGGSGQDLIMIQFTGLVYVSNMTGAARIGIGLNGGQVILRSDVTAGIVHVSGTGTLIDEAGNHVHTGTWNGGVTVINDLMNKVTVSEAVLDSIA